MAPFLVTSESTGRPDDTTDLAGSLYRCSFRAQTIFTAVQHVGQLRDVPCRRKEEPLVRSVWDIHAPDFAVKRYAPPIKKPPRAIAQPIDDGDAAEKRKREVEFRSSRNSVHFGAIADTENNDKDFILHFRILTPNTARRLAASNGKHPAGPYLDPKPHDHRGFPPIKSLGLPELVTSIQPDPLNIRFKNEHLDIHDLNQVQPERHQKVKSHWSTRKTPEPQWLQSLILHKEAYCKRYAAFTRHRRLDRTVYSALMERIVEDFASKLNNRPKQKC